MKDPHPNNLLAWNSSLLGWTFLTAHLLWWQTPGCEAGRKMIPRGRRILDVPGEQFRSARSPEKCTHCTYGHYFNWGHYQTKHYEKRSQLTFSRWPNVKFLYITLFAAQSGILGFIKSTLKFNSLAAKTFATRQKIIINPSNRSRCRLRFMSKKANI